MPKIYQRLLGLYPAEVRTLFAPEMSDVFAQVAADRRREGWFPYAAFILGEVIGVLAAAAAAHRTVHQPILDLRMMRPPGVSREVYGAALDELIAAQRLVDFNLGRMQRAIARQDFVKARFYSDEDRKARTNLRLLRRRYGVSE